MDYKQKVNCSAKCKCSETIKLFLLIISLVLLTNKGVYAQKKLETSFTLDTTQAQIFPSDLDFSLNLVDSKENRIRYVYLLKLNKNGEVTYDRQTRFKRAGQNPEWEAMALNNFNTRIESIFAGFKESVGRDKEMTQLAEMIEGFRNKKSIKNKAVKKKKRIKRKKKNIPTRSSLEEKSKLVLKLFKLVYKDSVEIWNIEKDKIEKDIENDSLSHAILKNLKCKLIGIEHKLNSHYKDSSFLSETVNIHHQLKQYKNEPSLSPLPIINREADTLTVEVHPLKPNRDYIILALEDGKKVEKFKELFRNYLECQIIEDKEFILIPNKIRNGKYSVPFKVTTTSKRIKKKINSTLLKYKELGDLLKVDFEKMPELENLENNKKITLKYPGPFEFPFCKSCNSNNDSVIKYSTPNDFNEDFRRLNSVLTKFNKYTSELLTGTYKIDLNRGTVDFNPSKELKDRLITITEHIQILNMAQESLALLKEIKNDSYFEFKNYFESLSIQSDNNRKKILERINQSEKLDNILGGVDLLFGLDGKTLEKNTHSYKFITRNSGLIKQSFGFLGYFSGEDGFSGVVPYTGVDFLIRSTNEDVRFGKIKGWEKRVSFQLGVPFFANSLTSSEGRKHLVGDSFSLFTGIGFNLGHALKISYGPLWFRSLSGNSLGEKTFKIKAVHAVSVGVNFKLIPLFKSIIGAERQIKI